MCQTPTRERLQKTNLTDAHPEIVAWRQALIKDYDADLKANSRPLWRVEATQ